MNLLVTGAWQGAKDGIEQLKTLGHQVQFLQFEKDELPCSYEWVEGVICNGTISFASDRAIYSFKIYSTDKRRI